MALINQTTARGEERLGEVNFPISCSPAAQAQFNRAVALLHSFFFPETVKAFTAIAEKEPSCAMAYWGIAISQRPNPLVGPFPGDVLKRGWEAIHSYDYPELAMRGLFAASRCARLAVSAPHA